MSFDLACWWLVAFVLLLCVRTVELHEIRVLQLVAWQKWAEASPHLKVKGLLCTREALSEIVRGCVRYLCGSLWLFFAVWLHEG